MASRTPSWFGQVAIIAAKDLRIELATREIVTTAGFFALLVTVIGSLAFFANKREDVAPGVIWISVAFSSVLALSRAWEREREEGALKGVLVSPISRSAIFAGKAIGVAAFVFSVVLIVTTACVLFFSLEIGKLVPPLLLLLCAAIPGIAAAGTLFGAMTVRTRARDLILSTVMLPLLAPSLLAGVAGTRDLFGGAPLSELGDYFLLLGLFDVVFVAGGLGLFDSMLEG